MMSRSPSKTKAQRFDAVIRWGETGEHRRVVARSATMRQALDALAAEAFRDLVSPMGYLIHAHVKYRLDEIQAAHSAVAAVVQILDQLETVQREPEG